MASDEHLAASNIIKTTHKVLRRQANDVGFEEAWKSHLRDTETLEQYAKAMQELGTKHWEENKLKNPDKVHSRVDWIVEQCRQYFDLGNSEQAGIYYQRKREITIAESNNYAIDDKDYLEITPKLSLLDVGSSYNPFKKIDIFDVTAIDIAPATSDVIKCDFLEYDNFETTYHIVAFSLLLEYLPHPALRLKACENAYKLLKPEGVLCIVTPDSKHVGANSKYMKSWRYVLAKLGFCRIKYDKTTYFHGMLFRKNLSPEVAKRWSKMNEHRGLFEELYIPQDFNDNKT